NFTFTYIGRTKRKLSKIIKPLYGKELADELGKYDIYVSGSKNDPGPNHVLQSLACKLPTYVAHDSGGAREFAGDDHIFSSFKELEYILLSKHFKQNNAIKLQSWEECITKYIEIMESLIENN
ncbi:hypothetical protein CMI47_03800, partial [Candidatus Pacearchaeota archaeon]|nr:hypothetical protein [Candidatus Pacearchaeota archaeon]